MLIVCPNCSRTYLVRAAEIARAGRLVRCSTCQTSWRPDVAETSVVGVAIPIDPIVEADIQRDVSSLNRTSRRPTRRLIAFGAIATTMAGLAMVVGVGKADGLVGRAMGWIDAMIPGSALAGLSFDKIRTRLSTENGEMALEIEGEITSDSERPKILPELQFTMRDGTESTIFQWMIPAPAATIAKGEAVPFKARLASPPRDAKDLTIRFSGA